MTDDLLSDDDIRFVIDGLRDVLNVAATHLDQDDNQSAAFALGSVVQSGQLLQLHLARRGIQIHPRHTPSSSWVWTTLISRRPELIDWTRLFEETISAAQVVSSKSMAIASVAVDIARKSMYR